jgi:hypothetical protein
VETTVPRAAHPHAHRFVVVYRIETREIPGAAEVRRGWVERVPDPREVEAGEADRSRFSFQALSDLPALITRMIDEVEARRPDAGDRRPA